MTKETPILSMTKETPILSVRDLKTYFFPDEGTVRAVDGASFDVFPGQTLGIVGESGCGKSVTARSILRIVERPGRIDEGQIMYQPDPSGTEAGAINLVKIPADGRQMRDIRGGKISLVFQEPMTSFSPVHTVGNQIVEAILLHQPVSRREARDRAIEMLRRVGVSTPEQRMDQLSNQLSGGLPPTAGRARRSIWPGSTRTARRCARSAGRRSR